MTEGFAKISITNLRRSEEQVRPLESWKVEALVKSMREHPDAAYQPYYVLTTSSLAEKSLWSMDTVSFSLCEYLFSVDKLC